MYENKNYSTGCNKQKLFLWQKPKANKNTEPPQHIIMMFYFVYFLYIFLHNLF
jgi:hypothetical protein